jgi:ABC-type transport system substrate-binding protein
MTDKSTVQSALRTGKIDRLSEVAWKDAVNLKETNPNLKFRSYFTAIPRAIRPRNDTAPFNDIRVRQALCMAIDYKGLAKTFFGDTPYLINGFLFPVHVGLYTPYEKYPKEIQDIYTYNTQKAKELLAQAGFPNGFKTTLNANPTTEPGLPEIIQSYLKQIGVETEIKYYETGAFNALRFSKNYDGLIQHWQAFYVNPLSLFGWYAEPTHTFNVGVVNDKELTRMYNEANSTFDDAKRKELIKQMDLYGMKQAYFIPVPIPLEYTIWQSWIKAYSGEGVIGLWQIGALSARIWVDQNLKSKLGK